MILFKSGFIRSGLVVVYCITLFALALSGPIFAGTIINNVPLYVDKLSTSKPLTRSIAVVPQLEVLSDGNLRASGGPLYEISGGAAGTPPAYGEWWRGCGPTSSGMLMGYWDTHGFDSLMPGDVSTENATVKNIIASQEHYNDYALPLDDIAHSPVLLADKSTTGGAHANNCIADYLRTSWSVDNLSYGWTAFYTSSTAKKGIGYGLRTYTRLANPTYDAQMIPKQWGSNINQGWTEFVAEIDAGYPVLMLVDTNGDNASDHIVPAFGYDTVNGVRRFACYTTWDANIHWYDFVPMSPGVLWGVGFAQLYHPKIKKVIRVSSTGNDINDGSSWGNAMRSVKAAVGVATISDEIWVAEGTYTGVNDSIAINTDIRIYGGFAGTESSLNQRNAKQMVTIINYEKGITFGSDITDECILDGFTIKTGNSWNGTYCIVGSSPTISNNRFDSGSSAVYSEGYPGPNVVNNVIIGTSQYGIYGVGNLIANNIISVPAGHGLNGGGTKIINNTITGCGGVGIYTVATTSLLANNIIAFNGAGVWKTADCTATLSKNCVYSNTTNYNVSVTPGINDIQVDPLFVNRVGGDYHIQPGSPCKDVGDDSVVIPGSRDMDGGNRILGLHVDIGADEFGVSNTAPIANAQNIALNKNVVKPITLTASDIDGDFLSYIIVTTPSHGALTGVAPDVTYTPTTGYTGTDSFTFKANDGKIDSAPVTVTITITEVLSSVVLSTNLASPRVTGSTLILTATPTGGVTVQYKFLDGSVVLRDFAPVNTFSWLIPADVVGVHNLSVIARDVNSATPDATVTSNKTFTFQPPLTSVIMTTNPVNAVLVGNTVTLTATATGGANVQYKFMSSGSVIRNFTNSKTYTFTATSVRNYSFSVLACDLNGIDPTATVTSATVSFAVKPALTSVSMTTTPLNAALANTSVTLTATPTGGALVQYKFLDGAVILRDFSPINKYSWVIPADAVNGVHTLNVIARDVNGVNPDATVTGSKTLIIKPPLTSVIMATNPANAVSTGKTVTLIATATGGTNIQYQFMAGTSLLRSFSSSNTFTFTPLTVKTYSFTVVARDINGIDPNATVTSSAVSLIVKPVLSAVAVTTAPLNAALIGTPVTITATPTGGANVQYQFMVGALILRSFANSNTFTFTPLSAKTYNFSVVARDLNSINPLATVTSPEVILVTRSALVAITAKTSPLNSSPVNTPVTITATPTGGANVQYKFMAGASLLRSFSSSNTFIFTPSSVKTYTFTVVARDLNGIDPNATVTSPEVNLAIKPVLSAVSLITSPVNTATLGTPVTLTATSTGGANIQYKFMDGATQIRSFNTSKSYTFTPAVAKTYSFTVVASDLNSVDPNLTYTSVPVTLVVTAP